MEDTFVQAKDCLHVALDMSETDALALAEQLQGHVGWLKVGMTLYYSAGPSIVRTLKDMGFKIFLDLKLHDIPHQVRGAACAAALSGADILTVHALGGAEMIAAARDGVEEAARQTGERRAQIICVTVLTSMDDAALYEIGVDETSAVEVARLASLALSAGGDGIVCSPQEAFHMRELLGSNPLIVCPGIRPVGAEAADQARVAEPAQAIRAGASMLVLGRPITQAPDPLAAADEIVAEIASALS